MKTSIKLLVTISTAVIIGCGVEHDILVYTLAPVRNSAVISENQPVFVSSFEYWGEQSSLLWSDISRGRICLQEHDSSSELPSLDPELSIATFTTAPRAINIATIASCSSGFFIWHPPTAHLSFYDAKCVEMWSYAIPTSAVRVSCIASDNVYLNEPHGVGRIVEISNSGMLTGRDLTWGVWEDEDIESIPWSTDAYCTSYDTLIALCPVRAPIVLIINTNTLELEKIGSYDSVLRQLRIKIPRKYRRDSLRLYTPHYDTDYQSYYYSLVHSVSASKNHILVMLYNGSVVSVDWNGKVRFGVRLRTLSEYSPKDLELINDSTVLVCEQAVGNLIMFQLPDLLSNKYPVGDHVP